MVIKLPSYFYLAFFVLLALFSFYFSLGLLASQIESLQFAPNMTNLTNSTVPPRPLNFSNLSLPIRLVQTLAFYHEKPTAGSLVIVPYFFKVGE